jgi:RNA polymerase sigma-70 factor (ECF subfamily)
MAFITGTNLGGSRFQIQTGTAKMTIEPDIRDQLLNAIPNLRAFAISLCGHRDRADDLVQDTLVKAWANMHRFERGTNLNAWLFTILRNAFFSEHRKLRREVEDVDGSYAEGLVAIPEQEGRLNLDDFRKALMTLSADQREALLLVGAEGMTYDEAAEICGCAVGTIKSRVNRARSRLAEILCLKDVDDLGPDSVIMAALPLAA